MWTTARELSRFLTRARLEQRRKTAEGVHRSFQLCLLELRRNQVAGEQALRRRLTTDDHVGQCVTCQSSCSASRSSSALIRIRNVSKVLSFWYHALNLGWVPKAKWRYSAAQVM